MQSADVIRALAVVMVFVVLFLAAIVVATIATRNRNDAADASELARKDISTCRRQRHVLIKQMLSMFGQSNPQKSNLEKLYELYPKANTEQRELEWEKKYIPVMQAFMAHAQTHARPEVAASWQMANQSIIDNESKLSAAREKYTAANETLKAYAQTPRSYAISFGDFLFHLFGQYKDYQARQVRNPGGEEHGEE